jgi:anti-sigma regulatory factor (Ser/Thr protein kinase)
MTRRISFRSDSCHLAEVRKNVRGFLSACGIDECRAELLVLAIDEACTNIIRHAYGGSCRPVRLTLHQKKDGTLIAALRDYGKPCDPAKIHGRPLTEIRPGGVGVHIIRRAFDEVVYLPRARGTRLLMIKHPAG